MRRWEQEGLEQHLADPAVEPQRQPPQRDALLLTGARYCRSSVQRGSEGGSEFACSKIGRVFLRDASVEDTDATIAGCWRHTGAATHCIRIWKPTVKTDAGSLTSKGDLETTSRRLLRLNIR